MNKQKQAEKLVSKATANFATMQEDISKSIALLEQSIVKDQANIIKIEEEITSKRNQITTIGGDIEAKHKQLKQYRELLEKIEGFVL